MTPSIFQCLSSLLYLHNETVNVFSHLVPGHHSFPGQRASLWLFLDIFSGRYRDGPACLPYLLDNFGPLLWYLVCIPYISLSFCPFRRCVGSPGLCCYYIPDSWFACLGDIYWILLRTTPTKPLLVNGSLTNFSPLASPHRTNVIRLALWAS